MAVEGERRLRNPDEHEAHPVVDPREGVQRERAADAVDGEPADPGRHRVQPSRQDVADETERDPALDHLRDAEPWATAAQEALSERAEPRSKDDRQDRVPERLAEERDGDHPDEHRRELEVRRRPGPKQGPRDPVPLRQRNELRAPGLNCRDDVTIGAVANLGGHLHCRLWIENRHDLTLAVETGGETITGPARRPEQKRPNSALTRAIACGPAGTTIGVLAHATFGARMTSAGAAASERERGALFRPKCGNSWADRAAVVVACQVRFEREHSSRKPSGAALEGDRRGLFRAQATRESRHGRRPRTAFFSRFRGDSSRPIRPGPDWDLHAWRPSVCPAGYRAEGGLAAAMRRRCLPCATMRPGAQGAGAEGRPRNPSASPPAPHPLPLTKPAHHSRHAYRKGDTGAAGGRNDGGAGGYPKPLMKVRC